MTELPHRHQQRSKTQSLDIYEKRERSSSLLFIFYSLSAGTLLRGIVDETLTRLSASCRLRPLNASDQPIMPPPEYINISLYMLAQQLKAHASRRRGGGSAPSAD